MSSPVAGIRVLSQERLGHQDHEDSPLCNDQDVCPHFLCWEVYPNKEVWAEDPMEGNQAKRAFSSQVENGRHYQGSRSVLISDL